MTADYDRAVDVLYVTLGVPVPAEGEGRGNGLELRYALDNERPCGATVIGYHRNNWPRQFDHLVGVLADHLTVGIDEVATAIRQAVE